MRRALFRLVLSRLAEQVLFLHLGFDLAVAKPSRAREPHEKAQPFARAKALLIGINYGAEGTQLGAAGGAQKPQAGSTGAAGRGSSSAGNSGKSSAARSGGTSPLSR